MSNPGIREIFDDISLSVISFLESHDGVTSVDFVERRGAALSEIVAFEQEHQPYLLPNDYKAFLLISNGLLLRWHIHHHETEFPLGCLHLNELSRVFRIKRNDEDSDEEYEESLVDGSGDGNASTRKVERVENTPSRSSKRGPKIHKALKRMPKGSAAFDLDDSSSGHVTLFYREGHTDPQIWFQDMSCQWFFIANTFTDYFRLMIMHLGLPCWQYAFTTVGLDPVSQQWFRFLSPERLAIDIDNKANLKNARHHPLKFSRHRLQLGGAIQQKLSDTSSQSSRNPISGSANGNPSRPSRLQSRPNQGYTTTTHSGTSSHRTKGSDYRKSAGRDSVSYSSAGRDRLRRPSSAPLKRRSHQSGASRLYNN